MDRPVGLRPGDDDHRRRRRGRIRTRACPGTARRSGATASSRRWRCCGWRPRSRAACSAYLAATQATAVGAGARRRARQDPARGARRRDGGAGRGAVRTLLRQRRRDAAVRDAGGGATTGAPATSRFLKSIAPSIQRALDWIERYGDADGDGFVEYARQTPHRAGPAGLEGLARLRVSRGRHAGRGADRARARCRPTCSAPGRRPPRSRSRWAAAAATRAQGGELSAQGGGDARALRGALLGRAARAPTCWRSTGRSAPAGCVSSNAGHALWTGIVADRARARGVAEALMRDDSFSGWGIRTIPSSQARYNPMAYHNGSVWPHDNAIIAAGFARYGFRDLVRAAARRDDGRERRRRPAPAARADLRVPAPPGRGADAVPGRVRAAGVGGGRGVHAAGGGAGAVRRRPHATRSRCRGR